MSKTALRYPESAIAGGMFGTARVRDAVAGAAARLASTAPVALDAPISQLVGGAQTPTQRMQALGRLPRGRMNKTEAAYAEQQLAPRLHLGEILEYKFEALKLRLADLTWYTPDFSVVLPCGAIEIHEVKGRWTDDARVKIKVAAELFGYYRFIAIRKVKGEWIREDF
ncbi:PDDEXK family nuclease [Paraburkholderia sediminicola]|uniref:hypothetical protein n=1 Tax=Paraburkholderia sediminicola TaxID=458836 RepID=UPI0038BDA448